MQHVNDDMDDLFKKAGEEYPLRKSMPDWNKVQQALHAQAAPPPIAKKSNTRYLWLLCLLPFALICNRYMGTNNQTAGNTAAADHTPQPPVPSYLPEKTASPSSKPLSQKSTNPTKQTVLASKKAGEKQTLTATTARFKKNAFKPVAGATNTPPKAVREIGDLTMASGEALPAHQESEAQANATHARMQTARAYTLKPESAIGLLPDSIYKAIAAQALLQPKATMAARPKSALRHKKGFYAGIMGSADLTSVQLQRTANVGWQYGILAGYAFHKRWSVEAGVFASRKYYYTEGRYFDKSHTYLPPNTDITEVSGYCNMLELPLAIKYDFHAGSKALFFATAGISSYIMKKEAYDYTYYYRGTGTYAVHDKYYRNASTNLFSVLHLGGGYTHSLGKSISVRVEPYLKLPLAGLGYGKLHFSSAGLSAGIVKDFRRR